jgi:hypothetical protein
MLVVIWVLVLLVVIWVTIRACCQVVGVGQHGICGVVMEGIHHCGLLESALGVGV